MSGPAVPSDPTATGAATTRSRVFRAAGIVVIAFIVSRILGVARDFVISYYFGADSLEVNAYVIAARLPDTIFHIVAGGALGSAFIPTFSAYFAREDTAGGWRLFSAVINLVALVTAAIAVVAAFFAPALIRLFFPDLIAQQPELLPLTAAIMRVMLLSPLIFSASGVVMGALNARHHFVLPAVAPIVYNLGIIAGAVLWQPDAMGLAYGAVLGALGHLAVQLPGLRQQQAHYSLLFSLRDPGVRRVLQLMGPRVLGLSFSYINPVITQLLAQGMILGSLRALDLGWRVMLMPQGVLGQALAIAAFPTFSTLAATSALAEMRRILADSLRLIAFLGLPATAAMMVLNRPVVALLFQYGQFDERDTTLVAWALLFYAFGLVPLAVLEIISRAFYALGDTRTPVLAGALQLLGMALLGYWLSERIFPTFGWLPLGGLALAASLSNFLEVGILLYWLRPKLGGVDGRHLLDGLWRMTAAVGLMAAAMAAVYRWFPLEQPLWQLAAGAVVGGLVYFLASLALRISELNQLLALGLRRFKRGNSR
jgi:putative peptidoglycan lipid II flippase